MDGGPIELGHTADFELAGLRVRPSTRELILNDQAVMIEPRVMQVLVALGRSPGTMLTRDDLIRDCWGGRIVGDDAINRVISRLRRIEEGVGKGRFRIETVTKVGYRLVLLDGGSSSCESAAPGAGTATRRPTAGLANRRLFVGGGIAALLLAGSGGYFFFTRTSAVASTALSPDAALLMRQADEALSQSTREGQNQAIGLYRRVVAIAPDHAPGWAALALTYALTAQYRQSVEGEAMRQRAVQAAQRAIAIDPGNDLAPVALAMTAPRLGNWSNLERTARTALTANPASSTLLTVLAIMLLECGRPSEALDLFDRAAALASNPTPGLYYNRIVAAWAAGRMEETDALVAEASSIFPTHFAIWFARFYVLMYSSRAAEAVAFAQTVDSRPSGIPGAEFEGAINRAKAIETQDEVMIDEAMIAELERARRGAGYAENTIQFASAVDRLDDAFAVAEAYYFGRGFEVPELRFTPEQGTFTPRRERLTRFLFYPSTARMRADARFAGLTEELGLTRYWRQSGSQPDYLKGL